MRPQSIDNRCLTTIINGHFSIAIECAPVANEIKNYKLYHNLRAVCHRLQLLFVVEKKSNIN